MSMRTYACWNWVIRHEDLCSMYPNETKDLEDALDNIGLSLDGFASDVAGDWFGDTTQEETEILLDKLDNLIVKFNKDNEPLELGLDYMSEDAQGDILEGGYWYVLNTEELVPSAKKLGDKIQLCSWTVFG
jgi:hypothetical protein